jgi:hypothetical protein
MEANMSDRDAADFPRQYNTLLLVVLAYSVVFIGVLFNGYYYLFHLKGVFVAGVVALLLSVFAWGIGKYIGSSPTGIKGNLPLFAMMLILSAAGVFNSLMLNLEGKRIFEETVDKASERYRDLSIYASANMRDENIESKIANVNSLAKSLAEEIRNVRNCGEGPEARKILDSIATELPGFTVLSGAGRDCVRAEEIIRAYQEQIQERLYNHQDLVKLDYRGLIKARDQIIASEKAAQIKLASIRRDISEGQGLLSLVRPRLEEVATDYQAQAISATKLSRSARAEALPTTLDMASVRDLGEWSQILNLLISRLDKSQTYIYLFLAVFADWMLVHLFALLASQRARLSPKKRALDRTVKSPW